MKTRREFFRKLFGAFAGTALAMKVTATEAQSPSWEGIILHERDYGGKWRFVMDVMDAEAQRDIVRIYTESHSDDTKLSELLAPR